jgi:uncharacterized protein DUF1186
MIYTYTEPVSKLIKLGRPEGETWLNYSELGITRAQIPDLIRLVEDHDLRVMQPPENLPDDVELLEWFAQIHAWRALAQLKAEEAIPAILGILHQVDDEDDDWIGEDASEIFALIGLAAIHPIADYLKDGTEGLYARVAAANSLRTIAKAYPETRNECAEILASVLENYRENDEGLNGFIIYDLVELKAVEYIDLIEKAFRSESVDEMIMGDFEDVQVTLGLIEERITKRAPSRLHQMLFGQNEAIEFGKKTSFAKRKEKNKRKQEKKSRKKNRKRK